MASLNIDGKDYDLEDMSDTARATVRSLQFLENKLQNLLSEQAVYNAAKQQYISMLKAEIETSAVNPMEDSAVDIKTDEIL